MEKLQNLNVIYEDNHIIVVEKKTNILVQKDDTNDISLSDVIKEYLKVKYNKPGNVYLGVVHRLDRPVGGIMVFAKTSKAASRLSDLVRTHNLKKTYYAVVEGKAKLKDHFEDYLIKDNKNNTSYVTKDKKNGKIAILDYELIDYKDNLSLVKINLVTGRSHQIRVQFAYHNLALVADQRYNKNAISNTNIALFAKSIEFIHPTTKEKLHFSLELPNRYPFNLFTK